MERMHQYMQECKMYEDDPYKYSFYVHGYLIPWFEQQFKAGKIKSGKYLRVRLTSVQVKRILAKGTENFTTEGTLMSKTSHVDMEQASYIPQKVGCTIMRNTTAASG